MIKTFAKTEEEYLMNSNSNSFIKNICLNLGLLKLFLITGLLKLFFNTGLLKLFLNARLLKLFLNARLLKLFLNAKLLKLFIITGLLKLFLNARLFQFYFNTRLFKFYFNTCLLKNCLNTDLLKIFSIITIIFSFSFFTALPVFSNASRTSGMFLTLNTGARPSSMGGAFTALADDINSVYYNPAGLGNISYNQFTFMHNNYFQGMRHQYIAYCQPLEFLERKNNGTIGMNVILFDAGTMKKTYIRGYSHYEEAGFYGAKDMAIGLSYGLQITETINLGLSSKYIKSTIDNTSANAVAFDLGIQSKHKHLKYPINLGLVIQNIGTKLKYDYVNENLPTQIRTGISSAIIFDYHPDLTFLPSVDFVYSDGTNKQVLIGSEFNYRNVFFIRVGFDSLNEAGSNFTAGIGSVYNEFSIDYAFSSFGDLENSHTFSFSYKFGSHISQQIALAELDRIPSYGVKELDSYRILPRAQLSEILESLEKDELIKKFFNAKEILGADDKRTIDLMVKIFNKANRLFGEGEFFNAIKYYSVIESIEKESDVIYYNLAISYYNLGKYNQALIYINKALARNPHELDNKRLKLFIVHSLRNTAEVLNLLNNLTHQDRQDEVVKRFIEIYSR